MKSIKKIIRMKIKESRNVHGDKIHLDFTNSTHFLVYFLFNLFCIIITKYLCIAIRFSLLENLHTFLYSRLTKHASDIFQLTTTNL